MYQIDDEDRDRSWLRRNLARIAGVVVIAGLGGAAYWGVTQFGAVKATPKQIQQVTLLKAPPPPPPPPPPPKVEEPKVVEKKEIFEPELQKLEQPKDVEKPDAPPPLGVDAVGTGPGDAYGLVGTPGGRGLLAGQGGEGGGGGTRWGWYAGIVQTQIQEALQAHEKTKRASFRPTVIKIWPDRVGRIVRVELVGSSGDQAIDAALANEVLAGITLKQPPPEGMKLPIVIRASARAPRQG